MFTPDLDRRRFLGLFAAGLGFGGPPIATSSTGPDGPAADFPLPVRIPDWVHGVTRMAFLSPAQMGDAAAAGAQVVHTNVVWPYYPLRKDGGGLSREDADRLRKCVHDCHRHGMKLVLGLPPFPPVALVRKHPDWRVDADGSGKANLAAPREDDLGTRLCCNLGPWGDYLIDVCAELAGDFDLDGYSFDGNYHPPLCHCRACKTAYQRDAARRLPARVDLDDPVYREYLVWRGRQLEQHYSRLQAVLKKQKPSAVIMSWTVNAGRYGHFLHSPRAMPTRLNRLFDLPMQEWWLDETNQGGSLAPAFGVAYLHATTGGRPCAAEPYLMSRGNPYSTDSFPLHERITRTLLALTHGSVTAQSLGWPGGAKGAAAAFRVVEQRAGQLSGVRRWPWAAILVSEQTRQFYAYKNLAERFLPHVFGFFRMAMEEHLPVTLINDWDITAEQLAPFRVLLLPNAAALSDEQVRAIREYVRQGGGLVATGESSLCDDLGRARSDFALADLFGVSFRGRPAAPLAHKGSPISLDGDFWEKRSGPAVLSWGRHSLVNEPKLNELVPDHRGRFRGPLSLVSEPAAATEVVLRQEPDGLARAPSPAMVARTFGKGRIVYLAAGLDAAMWSYAYPYQRLLLRRAVDWSADQHCPVRVKAPMCVQTSYWTRDIVGKQQLIIQMFNNADTTANHGLPSMNVPLREETLPIHSIQVRIGGRQQPRSFIVQPGGRVPVVQRTEHECVVTMPVLDVHSMLIGDY